MPPKRREDAEAGVAGEFWGVHGGGLYHSQKYRLAPPEMPEPLHWFKWEAYTTWLSGFALFVVLYYFDARIRLVDPGVADLDEWQAIALSVGGIALAWVVYDVLCRTVGQRSQAALAVVGTGLVAVAAWGAGELFAPRAAYLQVGVMLGTIMAANVFFVIIPAHRKLVAAMEEKREPDPRRCSRRRTGRCTTTTSRCRSCSPCSPATSRSCSAPTTRGSSSSRSRC